MQLREAEQPDTAAPEPETGKNATAIPEAENGKKPKKKGVMLCV